MNSSNSVGNKLTVSPAVWPRGLPQCHLDGPCSFTFSCKFLITYLNKYPLKTIKNIAYNKWLKLYRVIEEGGRGKSYEEIKLMAQNINKYEDEDKVQ